VVYGRKARFESAISWPWEENYNIETYSDSINAGILIFEVRTATFNVVQDALEPDWEAYHFDGQNQDHSM
jgi:hypothetical protein